VYELRYTYSRLKKATLAFLAVILLKEKECIVELSYHLERRDQRPNAVIDPNGS
jgi:hypothetical protein